MNRWIAIVTCVVLTSSLSVASGQYVENGLPPIQYGRPVVQPIKVHHAKIVPPQTEYSPSVRYYGGIQQASATCGSNCGDPPAADFAPTLAPTTGTITTLPPNPSYPSTSYPSTNDAPTLPPTTSTVTTLPPTVRYAPVTPTPSYAPRLAPISYRPPTPKPPRQAYLSRGLYGQPTVHVPGQPVRNFWRYLTP